MRKVKIAVVLCVLAYFTAVVVVTTYKEARIEQQRKFDFVKQSIKFRESAELPKNAIDLKYNTTGYEMSLEHDNVLPSEVTVSSAYYDCAEATDGSFRCFLISDEGMNDQNQLIDIPRK